MHSLSFEKKSCVGKEEEEERASGDSHFGYSMFVDTRTQAVSIPCVRGKKALVRLERGVSLGHIEAYL